jgi:hypothetical protein
MLKGPTETVLTLFAAVMMIPPDTPTSAAAGVPARAPVWVSKLNQAG